MPLLRLASSLLILPLAIGNNGIANPQFGFTFNLSVLESSLKTCLSKCQINDERLVKMIKTFCQWTGLSLMFKNISNSLQKKLVIEDNKMSQCTNG